MSVLLMRVRWMAAAAGLAVLLGGGWLASAATAREDTPPVRLGPAVVGVTPPEATDTAGTKKAVTESTSDTDDDGDDDAVAVPDQPPRSVADDQTDDDTDDDTDEQDDEDEDEEDDD